MFTRRFRTIASATMLAGAVLTVAVGHTRAEQPPPPCHPNPIATTDMTTVSNRGDVLHLPMPLKNRLVQMAGRPHSVLPMQAYAEANGPSQLFQYYLLETSGFESNVFTAIFPNINDAVQLTTTGGNCGLPTIGSVRVVLEPKPGLPTDPNDPRAFIDVFTDLDGLFVINNESGWYEGWMIHDLAVPKIAPPRADGTAQFGMITVSDAAALKAMGTGHNVPGQVFTTDGRAEHLPSVFDHFPDVQSNVLPLYLSMGAFNALQQSDAHGYWEFNYQGTNWVHPLYELPFTGGFPDALGEIPDAFGEDEIGKLPSIVPGSGPRGVRNLASAVGDDPNLPRDPDKFDGTVDDQREFRERGVPSGLAEEVLLDVYERPFSFEHGVTNLERRLFDAYAKEVARVDANGDGIISAVEGDVDTPSDGFADNARLYLPPTVFNRFAVTREINDGLLAPRFSPSQRAWVLAGTLVPVHPSVPASAGRDGDDR